MLAHLKKDGQLSNIEIWDLVDLADLHDRLPDSAEIPAPVIATT